MPFALRKRAGACNLFDLETHIGQGFNYGVLLFRQWHVMLSYDPKRQIDLGSILL